MTRMFMSLLLFAQPLQAQRIQSIESFATDNGNTYIGQFQLNSLKRVNPPAEFLLWWDEMKVCTGLKAAYPEDDGFDKLGWFYADAIYRFGEFLLGLSFEVPPEVIVLTPELVSIIDPTPRLFEGIIKHEILHHLLYLQEGPVRASVQQPPFKQFTHCLPLAPKYGQYHEKDSQ